MRINRHRLWQLVADAGLIALAWYLAFELRFDHGVPPYYDTLFRKTLLIVIGIKLAVFVLSGFYERWWRYVSVSDMWGAARGVDDRLVRRRPDRLLLLAGQPGSAAAVGCDPRLAAAARPDRRDAAAGAHTDRAAAERRSSRAARKCWSPAPATRASS